MLTYYGKLPAVLKNQQAVYSFLCIGITASLIFWPLVNAIFCFLLLLYWLLSPGKRLSFKEWTIKKAALFAALYLPVIFGVFYSGDTSEATFRVQQKASLLIFPLVFASLPIVSTLLKKKIFWTLVFSTAIGCLLGIGNGLFYLIETGKSNLLFGYPLVVLKEMHPSVFGLCCLLSIGFLLEELASNREHLSYAKRSAYLLLVSFFVIFLALMGNRNNLICLNIISVIYVFRIFKQGHRRLLILGALVVIWTCALIFIPSFNQRWRELITQTNTAALVHNSLALPDSKTARLKIWNSVLDVVRDNWLFGVGTGDSQAALQNTYRQKNYVFASHNNCNAHNQYLQETIAFGIPGLVIFMLCLVIPFAYFRYSKEHSLYMVFLLLFAIVCLSESILQISKGIIWYSFFNALFAFSSTDK